MRYVYTTLIGLLAVIILIFCLQNLRNVTISFLNMGATLPLAVLVMLVYVAGMATGGFALTLLRKGIAGASR